MTTWNPSDKHANVTLSGGNLTAAASAATNIAGVRSTTPVSSGKVVVAFTLNGVGWVTMGAANASANLGNAPGKDNNNGFCYQCPEAHGNGPPVTYYSNSGGTSAGGISQLWITDTYYLAIDFDAKLAWFRATFDDWNGSSSNDPDAGTGGLSFSTGSGPFYLFYGGANNGDSITVDFAPSGHGLASFLGWDDAGGASATLTGAAATAARGSLVSGAVVGVAGVSGSAGAGSLAAGSPSIAALAGVSAATAASATTPESGAALAGIAAAGQGGAIAGSSARSIAGAQTTAENGSAAPASPNAPSLAGLQATGASGAFGSWATARLAGLPLSAALGSLSAPGLWLSIGAGAGAWNREAAAEGAWSPANGGEGSWT